jgi:SAM-dependent methyltransferase
VEAAISGLGLEVFAFDLSFSVDELVNRRKALAPGADHLLHLFQANVMEPPFKVEAFDYVHSAGVLHHTPDTFRAFAALSECVRSGGKYYIEVYSAERKNPIVYWTCNALRIFTTRMPLALLKRLCLVMAFSLWLFYQIRKVVGKKTCKLLTMKEITLSFFDCFSPPYQHHHTTAEVMGWFRQLDYRNMVKTFENRNGFGITGVKKSRLR